MERSGLSTATIYVLDDDAGFRSSMEAMAESQNLNCHSYSNANAFLSIEQFARPSCLILDHSLETGTSGISVLNQLNIKRRRIPTILCTAYASVSLVVEYMQAGIHMVFEKPLQGKILAKQIINALEIDAQRMQIDNQYESMRRKYDSLTPRQQLILRLIGSGTISKRIAVEIDVSPRTIDLEKSIIYTVLEIDSPIALGRWITELLMLHRGLGYSDDGFDLGILGADYAMAKEMYTSDLVAGPLHPPIPTHTSS